MSASELNTENQPESHVKKPTGLFDGTIGLSIVLVGATLLSVMQVFGLGFSLPDSIPVHFDFNGKPDRFSSRNGHMLFHILLVTFNAVFFLFLAWVSPMIPDSMINMPNKEYWLDDVRRESTMKRLQKILLWIGTATSIFFATLFFLTWVVAKELSNSISPWIWILLIVYLAIVFGLAFLGFKKPASGTTTH